MSVLTININTTITWTITEDDTDTIQTGSISIDSALPIPQQLYNLHNDVIALIDRTEPLSCHIQKIDITIDQDEELTGILYRRSGVIINACFTKLTYKLSIE